MGKRKRRTHDSSSPDVGEELVHPLLTETKAPVQGNLTVDDFLHDCDLTLPNNKTKIAYRFTGKLSLFPLILLSILLSSLFLLTRGNLHYSHGYFESGELYYGLAGSGLFVVGVFFGIALARWVVVTISFIFTNKHLIILKQGLFRKTELKFNLDETEFYYYRTSFIERQAWLQLIVKESNHYYCICSWKGSGNQKDRFFTLFKKLQIALASHQKKALVADEKQRLSAAEIVSDREVSMINPFTARIARLNAMTELRKEMWSAEFTPALRNRRASMRPAPTSPGPHSLPSPSLAPDQTILEYLTRFCSRANPGFLCRSSLLHVSSFDHFFDHFAYLKRPLPPSVTA